YSRDDIDRINEILALLAEGVSIGQVPALLQRRAKSSPDRADPVWTPRQDRVTEAIVRFDEAALELVFSEALSAHPIAEVTAKLVLPVLKSLGDRWAAG